MTTTDRKTEILAAASDLLLVQGWAGFSYQDLSNRLGIAKPSIHHHFPTKEALGLALIRTYGEHLTVMQEEVQRGSAEPADQLRAMLAFGSQEVADQEHSICPGGALHSNYELFPESMQRAVRELSERMHAWLSDLLGRGREAGQLHFEGEPTEAAWTLMATLQGGRQHSRTHGAEVWEAVSRQIASQFLQAS